MRPAGRRRARMRLTIGRTADFGCIVDAVVVPRHDPFPGGRRVNAPVQGSGVSDHGAGTTAFAVLVGLSVSHLLNDTIQSLLPAIYPLIKQSFALDYGQIGLITFTFQLTASLLQPFIGVFTDRHPQPYSLPIGMGFSFFGLLLLSMAPTYGVILLAAGLVGTGSSVFHPESSRLARLASGGRHGFAQSIFQVGGNVGAAIGPLLAAAIVVPRRPRQHRLVLDPGDDRHRRPVDGQHLVSPEPLRRDPPPARGGAAGAAGHQPGSRRAVAGRAGGAGVLQVLLSGELPQLLPFLPDRPLSPAGAGGPGAALRLPVLVCRRHADRRTARRPLRAQIHHLGVDPRHPALHADPAACRIWSGR